MQGLGGGQDAWGQGSSRLSRPCRQVGWQELLLAGGLSCRKAGTIHPTASRSPRPRPGGQRAGSQGASAPRGRGCFLPWRPRSSGVIVFWLITGYKFPGRPSGTRQEMGRGCREGQGIGVGGLERHAAGRRWGRRASWPDPLLGPRRPSAWLREGGKPGLPAASARTLAAWSPRGAGASGPGAECWGPGGASLGPGRPAPSCSLACASPSYFLRGFRGWLFRCLSGGRKVSVPGRRDARTHLIGPYWKPTPQATSCLPNTSFVPDCQGL